MFAKRAEGLQARPRGQTTFKPRDLPHWHARPAMHLCRQTVNLVPECSGMGKRLCCVLNKQHRPLSALPGDHTAHMPRSPWNVSSSPFGRVAFKMSRFLPPLFNFLTLAGKIVDKARRVSLKTGAPLPRLTQNPPPAHNQALGEWTLRQNQV